MLYFIIYPCKCLNFTPCGIFSASKQPGIKLQEKKICKLKQLSFCVFVLFLLYLLFALCLKKNVVMCYIPKLVKNIKSSIEYLYDDIKVECTEFKFDPDLSP